MRHARASDFRYEFTSEPQPDLAKNMVDWLRWRRGRSRHRYQHQDRGEIGRAGKIGERNVRDLQRVDPLQDAARDRARLFRRGPGGGSKSRARRLFERGGTSNVSGRRLEKFSPARMSA